LIKINIKRDLEKPQNSARTEEQDYSLALRMQ
jgi:hypothetical protein